MATKDERYDPDIDAYCSSDDEKTTDRNCYSGWELNNACQKISSPIHYDHASLDSIFIFNNTRSVDERSGGPLGDNPPATNPPPAASAGQSSSTPKPICLNCEEETSVWHEGSRFTCHIRFTDDQEAHNQLCTKCATTKALCKKCPYHPNALYHESVDKNVIPHIVKRFK